jgi:hypothetical protein
MADEGGERNVEPSEASEGLATTTGAHTGRALPMTVAGHVVAVLYADQVGEPPNLPAASWTRTIEILARHASRCLEGMTARKASAMFANPRS